MLGCMFPGDWMYVSGWLDVCFLVLARGCMYTWVCACFRRWAHLLTVVQPPLSLWTLHCVNVYIHAHGYVCGGWQGRASRTRRCFARVPSIDHRPPLQPVCCTPPVSATTHLPLNGNKCALTSDSINQNICIALI